MSVCQRTFFPFNYVLLGIGISILTAFQFTACDSQILFFFSQDYDENMKKHKANKMWRQWNLEDTAKKLERRFPSSFVWVVRPGMYHDDTYSRFHNFVETDSLGVPDHRNSDDAALKHLRALLDSAVRRREYRAL